MRETVRFKSRYFATKYMEDLGIDDYVIVRRENRAKEKEYIVYIPYREDTSVYSGGNRVADSDPHAVSNFGRSIKITGGVDNG